ncbi:hypothetical protein F5Y15DRAFT_415559 [Xylariaceae sp. FL0016]|nr:hypothetical protein F5Y15DRAFT_415559 [Xylariaceae sp. FL0016]
MATSSSADHKDKFWLEFRLYSDGLETPLVKSLDLTWYHERRNPVFSRFTDLPVELRLKIWEYLIAPRILMVACLEPSTSTSPYTWPDHPQSNTHPSSPPHHNTSIPPLLHVCHESRVLALSHYELTFSWKLPHVLAGLDLAPPSPSHPSAVAATPVWSQPRAWFSYRLDALYLVGELAPADAHGFGSPMAYFLSARDTRRVRRVALRFAALRYGESGSQQIFGTLFHVADRFPRAEAGRVLVCVAPADEMTHALIGGEGPLVGDGDDDGDDDGDGGGRGQRRGEGGKGIAYRYAMSDERRHHVSVDAVISDAGISTGQQRISRRRRVEDEANVVQRIWRDWYRGSIVTSALANMEFVLIRESDLERRAGESVTQKGIGTNQGWTVMPS